MRREANPPFLEYAYFWVVLYILDVATSIGQRRVQQDESYFVFTISCAYIVFVCASRFGDSDVARDLKNLCFFDVLVQVFAVVAHWSSPNHLIWPMTINADAYQSLNAMIILLKLTRLSWAFLSPRCGWCVPGPYTKPPIKNSGKQIAAGLFLAVLIHHFDLFYYRISAQERVFLGMVPMLFLVLAARRAKANDDAILQALDYSNAVLSAAMHELGQPLAAMTAALHRLRPIADDSEAGRYALRKAELAVRLLYRKIEQYTTFGKLAAGETLLGLTKSTIITGTELTTLFATDYADFAETYGVSFQWAVEEDWEFVCQAEIFIGILDNLLNNAFKHGGGEVSIRIGSEDDAIAVDVASNGKNGQTFTENTFAEFKKNREGQNHRKGLGLGIIEAFVTLLSGEIAVAPQSGGGVLFKIKIEVKEIPFDNSTKA